jgi:hypothetical protein
MAFELEVNGRPFIINEDNILYVQLGDGSVPKDKAISVDICMLDQKHITIKHGTTAEAQETYNKIKKRLIVDMNLTEL